MAKRFVYLLFISLFTLLSACTDLNKQYTWGKENFQSQNYQQSFKNLEPVALEGNRDAQYAVGYMYFYGLGTIEDRTAALYWVERAATQDQTQAQTALKIIAKSKGDVSKDLK